MMKINHFHPKKFFIYRRNFLSSNTHHCHVPQIHIFHRNSCRSCVLFCSAILFTATKHRKWIEFTIFQNRQLGAAVNSESTWSVSTAVNILKALTHSECTCSESEHQHINGLADHCNTTWKTVHTTTSGIHQPTRFSESWLLNMLQVGGGPLPLSCPPPNSSLLLLVQILGHRAVGTQDLLVSGAGVVKLVLLVGVLQVTSQTF